MLGQGYFPEGLYAAPTDEALVSDLLALKAMGFNAIRKHMKVDTRRWFWHADRLGFLVWQDIPQQITDFGRFQEEVRTNWAAHKGSPALVQWQLYNEGWGEGTPQQSNDTVALLRSLEPREGTPGGRLVNDASGGRGLGCGAGWVDPNACVAAHGDDSYCIAVFWTGGCGDGSVVDNHHYPEPRVPYNFSAQAAAGKPFVLGEYGGYDLAVANHSWGICDSAAVADPALASWRGHDASTVQRRWL